MSRGKRRKAQKKEEAPSTIEDFSEASNSAAKRAWAGLIQQVSEVALLACPRCGGGMRIIAFIEQRAAIGKILTQWVVAA